MRENEFEYQVQQKMGEFNLRPSEDVWMEVERRIREEKKRRFIFWWPLLFLLVGGGIAAGILLTNKKEKSGTIVANKSIEKPFQSSSEKINLQEHVNNSKNTDNTNTATSKNITAILKENNNEITITSGKSASNLKPANRKKETEPTAIIKKEIGKEDNNKDIVPTETQIKDQEPELPVTTFVSSNPTAPSRDTLKTNEIAVVAKQEIVENKKPAQQVMQPTDSVIKEQITKPADKKAKKWDWGISFSAGRSGIGQGFSFGGQRLYFDALALQTSSPSGLFSYSSSQVRSSFLWAAGFYSKKAVSKKVDVNVGLGYTFLSTKINIGSRVDSVRRISNYYSQGLTVGNFYRFGNSSYTNGFHFISLSGDVSWRIITVKKINIYWENGLSYNRMLGSSILHYDRNLQGYYKDNSFLTKNHLSYTTGFSFPLSKRLLLNPFVSYNLTPVLKKSDSQHFTNYGIRIRVLMNKK